MRGASGKGPERRLETPRWSGGGLCGSGAGARVDQGVEGLTKEVGRGVGVDDEGDGRVVLGGAFVEAVEVEGIQKRVAHVADLRRRRRGCVCGCTPGYWDGSVGRGKRWSGARWCEQRCRPSSDRRAFYADGRPGLEPRSRCQFLPGAELPSCHSLRT